MRAEKSAQHVIHGNKLLMPFGFLGSCERAHLGFAPYDSASELVHAGR